MSPTRNSAPQKKEITWSSTCYAQTKFLQNWEIERIPPKKLKNACFPLFHLKSHVIPPIPLLPTNRAVRPRPYPVSLKSTKLASPRLLTKLPNSTVYVSGAQGAQEKRRGVVCKYRRRQEEGSRGCIERTGTSGWTEGGSSTGEQSTPQEFDLSAGGSIAGELGDGSSLGGKGVDKGSVGAREANGVTD